MGVVEEHPMGRKSPGPGRNRTFCSAANFRASTRTVKFNLSSRITPRFDPMAMALGSSFFRGEMLFWRRKIQRTGSEPVVGKGVLRKAVSASSFCHSNRVLDPSGSLTLLGVYLVHRGVLLRRYNSGPSYKTVKVTKMKSVSPIFCHDVSEDIREPWLLGPDGLTRVLSHARSVYDVIVTHLPG